MRTRLGLYRLVFVANICYHGCGNAFRIVTPNNPCYGTNTWCARIHFQRCIKQNTPKETITSFGGHIVGGRPTKFGSPPLFRDTSGSQIKCVCPPETPCSGPGRSSQEGPVGNPQGGNSAANTSECLMRACPPYISMVVRNHTKSVIQALPMTAWDSL